MKIPNGAIGIRISKKNRQHNGQKKKVRKDKQRSTKHTYKTKDRVTRTPLETGGELRCSRRICSSCSTSGTRHVNLVTNPVINHEWGKDGEVLTTNKTCNHRKQITLYSIIFRNVTVVSSSYFGTGMSNVKIEDLNCTGDETHIAACNFTGWGHIQCHNSVGLICGKICL